MSRESKKSYVLQKVEYLIELMEETYNKDQVMKKNLLFPDNYLEVLQIRDILIRDTQLPKTKLIKLNYYFREMSAIKDSIEEYGHKMEYKEFIDWKVRDILEDGDEEHPIQKATHYVRENLVKVDGQLFSIENAAEYVEQIRAKHSIKKR